jgi:N-acetylglutamate synthase-like GNAT family acetyltransferase
MGLREATEADAPRLAELVKAAYGHYVERLGLTPRPMSEDYAQVVRDKCVLVAERGGDIAGLIVLAVDDEGFLVDNVAVHPAHQGTGVGRELLERAEAEALAAGHSSLYLFTAVGMTENIALYTRIGYLEYDRRTPRDVELVYLRKELVEPPAA